MLTDFLIQIKNASMAGNKTVTVKVSKKIERVAMALKKIGFLDEVKVKDGQIAVGLTFKNKEPILQDVKLVSKPGLRVYKAVWELETHKRPSVFLVSTPKGVISSKEAIKLRVGGEVIAEIL